MKVCNKCKEVKPLSEFHVRAKSIDGHRTECKSCISKRLKIYAEKNKNEISTKKKIYHKLNEEKRKQYYIENKDIISVKKKIYAEKNKNKISDNKKAYNVENKDIIKIRNKIWYDNNKEEYKEKIKEYYIENKEKVKKYQKEYNIKNKDKINDSKRKYYKKNIHVFVWRQLLKRTIQQFGTKKSNTTIKMLGYTPEQLKIHLESQFTEQMDWSNYGQWHVDHIKPVSTFNKAECPSIVNSLSNLRPLWATNIEINGTFYEGNLNRKIIKENYV